MSSALEILLVVLVVALFFGAGRFAVAARGVGRTVGRFVRTAGMPAEAAPGRPPVAALPRPPAAG